MGGGRGRGKSGKPRKRWLGFPNILEKEMSVWKVNQVRRMVFEGAVA